METFIVTQHLSYLLGCESWNEPGYIVPVYGVGDSPQRAQHHVQHQDVVVVGKVVVVWAEAAHLYGAREITHKRQVTTQKASTCPTITSKLVQIPFVRKWTAATLIMVQAWIWDILWFQLLCCEDVLRFFVECGSKLVVFGFWTAALAIQTIWLCHLGLQECLRVISVILWTKLLSDNKNK